MNLGRVGLIMLMQRLSDRHLQEMTTDSLKCMKQRSSCSQISRRERKRATALRPFGLCAVASKEPLVDACSRDGKCRSWRNHFCRCCFVVLSSAESTHRTWIASLDAGTARRWRYKAYKFARAHAPSNSVQVHSLCLQARTVCWWLGHRRRCCSNASFKSRIKPLSSFKRLLRKQIASWRRLRC